MQGQLKGVLERESRTWGWEGGGVPSPEKKKFDTCKIMT